MIIWYPMIKWHHTFRSQILTTCDTDVPLCPLSTFINIHPPSPPKPITGPSFRWSRGICSLPSMNTNLTGTCGLSDTPEKFSLFDEQKPISVDFLENRPTLAPPSFLQPVEKSTKFYLSEYLWILMQIVDFSRFPAKWYLVTCSRPVCSPGPPPRHLSLPRSPPGSFLPFYVFLSFVFLSFCIFLCCLFVQTSLRSNVWRVSSFKSHYLSWNSKVAVTEWLTALTHWLTKVRYMATRAAKNIMLLMILVNMVNLPIWLILVNLIILVNVMILVYLIFC